MRLLQDKVALVTGGSSGIGKAASLAFAREGAKVAIAYIQVERGMEAVNVIRDADGEAIIHYPIQRMEDNSSGIWQGDSSESC